MKVIGGELTILSPIYHERRVEVIMVDHGAKMYLALRQCRQEGRISDLQAAKIESAAARTFSDDVDISHGALSAPHVQTRPGQRDDAVNCSFVSMITTL